MCGNMKLSSGGLSLASMRRRGPGLIFNNSTIDNFPGREKTSPISHKNNNKQGLSMNTSNQRFGKGAAQAALNGGGTKAGLGAIVTLKHYCEVTGDTPYAVHNRRRRGIWQDGVHCQVKANRRLWINVPAVNEWLMGST